MGAELLKLDALANSASVRTKMERTSELSLRYMISSRATKKARDDLGRARRLRRFRLVRGSSPSLCSSIALGIERGKTGSLRLSIALMFPTVSWMAPVVLFRSWSLVFGLWSLVDTTGLPCGVSCSPLRASLLPLRMPRACPVVIHVECSAHFTKQST